ncbi:MAG: hypothetical protein ACT6RN_16415 [Agrobacterium sp.]|uniref:hypothetical protein n=1 Tax=Agrobacterium sp. TaxID=361 RepID=UPI004037AB7B
MKTPPLPRSGVKTLAVQRICAGHQPIACQAAACLAGGGLVFAGLQCHLATVR